MRTRRARRLLAAAMVSLVVVGTAYAQLAIVSPIASSNTSIPVSTVGYVVFSVRNTGSTSLDITTFTQQMMLHSVPAGCVGVTLGRLDDPGMQAATLGPNEQQQYIATTVGSSATGPKDCIWDIATVQGPTAQVTTSFVVSNTPSTFDLQAPFVDFGTQLWPSFETQTVQITNYGSSQTASLQITNSIGGTVGFAGACSGQSCLLPFGSGTTASVGIRCQPFMGSSFAGSAQLLAFGFGSGSGSGSGSNLLASSTIQCNALSGSGAMIFVGPNPLTIVTPIGVTGSGSATVTAMQPMTVLSSATVIGNFNIADCGAQTCNFGSGLPLPTPLTITCVGSAATQFGTLQVFEPGGGSAFTNLNCSGFGSGSGSSVPALHVMPSSLDFGSLAVGTSGSATISLDNIGSVNITGLQLAFGALQAAHWQADDCVSNTCTITPSDPAKIITITFQPQSHGDKGTALSITSNASPASVTLMGIGLGAVMSANPTDLVFGTTGLDDPRTRTITVTNNGNTDMTVQTGALSPPFSVQPTSVTVSAGMPQTLTVTCQSSTPSAGTIDDTLTITSPNAYAGSPVAVDLHCGIANTRVQVAPQSFDFGEVRINSPARTIDVTVTNPASATAAAHIASMQLRAPFTGLGLTPPMTNTTLDPGAVAQATLTLATNVETDVDGAFLDIGVDSEMLALPITGKVVTASSRIAPREKLDLGTACVGTVVTGDVTLSNDGTATLTVQEPQIDQSFLASTAGITYPASLAAEMSLTASVAPAMSALGPIAGTLTWDDDVPSHYEIDVDLEYITTGTAVSPAALDFGTIAVDAAATPKHILIENCDLAPTDVTIKAINTKQGPVGAWVIEPRLGYKKTLPAHDQQGITVTFRPPARGRYEASLEILTAAGSQSVQLSGDATGRDFSNTSFYACACSGPGAPSQGWPIVLALIVICRRRGSSSPR